MQSRLETGLVGHVRTEQTAPTRHSVLLPHIESDLRLCWTDEDGSSGIWSWAGPGPCQMICGQEPVVWDIRKGLPLQHPTGGCSGYSPFQCPPFQQKARCFGPGSFLVVCPAFSALQTPLEVVGESEQLTASYPYWITVKSRLLETLKASSAKTDSGVWGPAWNMCNFLWVSGTVWMIKHMASSVIPSVDSGSVWVSSLNPLSPSSGRPPGSHLFPV